MGVSASSPRNAVNVSTIVGGDFETNCRRAEQNSSLDYCNAHFSKSGLYRTTFIDSLNWKKSSAAAPQRRKEKSLWMRIASRLSGKLNHYNHHHHHHQPQQPLAGTMAKDEDLENNNENRFDSCLVATTATSHPLKHLSGGGVCPAKRTPVSTIAYGDRILREITVKTRNVSDSYGSANVRFKRFHKLYLILYV